MNAERQIFRVFGAFYNLDFIEDLYEKGRIQKKDVIQIADGIGEVFETYRLETLQTLYGSEFPFRRHRRKKGLFYDSSSSDQEEEPSEPPADKIETILENQVNVDNEKCSEKTKRKVKKRKNFPLIYEKKDLKSNKTEKFPMGRSLRNAVDSISVESETRLAEHFAPLLTKTDYPSSCRLCGVSLTRSIKCILYHIVTVQHYRNLREYGYFRDDYNFLINEIREMLEKPKTNKRQSSVLNYSIRGLIRSRLEISKEFPMIFHPDLQILEERKPFLKGGKLRKLVDEMAPSTKRKLETHFAELIHQVKYPIACDLCERDFSYTSMILILRHIISEEHYSKLRQHGYYRSDYKFLCNMLEFLETRRNIWKALYEQTNRESEKPDLKTNKEVKDTTSRKKTKSPACPINTQKNKVPVDSIKEVMRTHSIPLMFDPNDVSLGKREIFKHGEKLKTLSRKLDEDIVNKPGGLFEKMFEFIGYPKLCALCDIKLEPKPYSMISHFASDLHIDRLKEHGYYKKDFTFWSRVIEEMNDDYMEKSEVSKIPLIFDPKDETLGARVVFTNGRSLRRLVEKVDSSYINKENGVFDKFFKKIGYPEKCTLCVVQLSKSASFILKHLVSDQHYEQFKQYGYYPQDYEFWSCVLNLAM